MSSGFDQLEWHKDRVLLDELVFRLQHYKSDAWELGEDCFLFFKIKELVDQYAHFWKMRESFRVERLFELGIWDGGSVAFWSEMLRPQKHVAVDIADRNDSPYFHRYIYSRELQNKVVTHWHTDQSDRGELERIIRGEFGGPLDLVIDDASHLYHLTKASFEVIFPHLRPGGLYVIEDWAWEHWKGFEGYGSRPSLTQLVIELVEATGSSKTFISNLTVYEGFVVVEKGSDSIPASDGFSLDHHIYRGRLRESGSVWHSQVERMKRISRRFLR